MNAIFIIVIAIAVIVILVSIGHHLSYTSVMKGLRLNYGEDPENNYDDRAYDYMSSYFKFYEVPLKDQLDQQTWKDLQMDIIFSQLDHTKSQIGSEYMYRYMRDQRDKDLDTLEEHIQYFIENIHDREQLLYTFEKIKAVDNLDMIEHIKNPKKFPDISTWLIKLSGIASMIAILLIPAGIFFAPSLRLVAIIANLVMLMYTQMLYQKNMTLSSSEWELLYVISYMLDATKQVLKLDDPVFEKSQERCRSAYDNVNFKMRRYSVMARLCILKYSTIGVCPFLSWHFGIYGWIYNGAIKMFKENTDDILTLYDQIGYYELVIAQGSYREQLEVVNHPTFADIDGFDFENLIHPLLKNPVPNTKYLSSRFLITGANASGKTTFAKTLILNMYLSQQLNICFASKLRFRKAKLYSSIAIEDDLLRGDSFYIVEIKRLKYFLDIAKDNKPCVFFLDEILKGTNTLERIAASSTILEYFTQYNCSIGLTTHDIELSKLLDGEYTNYHFKEDTVGDEMHYDYLIYDGATTGSNAISLLKYCGYDDEIVNEAMSRAEKYKKTGSYK